MDKPLEMTFRNVDHNDSIARIIADKCEQLERTHCYISSMHVTVETPCRKYRKDGHYHIRIGAKVPGRSLAVSYSSEHTVRQDNASLISTVDDAFMAIAQQLESYARRQTKALNNIKPGAFVRIVLYKRKNGSLAQQTGAAGS